MKYKYEKKRVVMITSDFDVSTIKTVQRERLYLLGLHVPLVHVVLPVKNGIVTLTCVPRNYQKIPFPLSSVLRVNIGVMLKTCVKMVGKCVVLFLVTMTVSVMPMNHVTVMTVLQRSIIVARQTDKNFTVLETKIQHHLFHQLLQVIIVVLSKKQIPTLLI
jgi:hypothetical protein